ncbi:hypothetical protein ACLB2K_016917 [Fragaria x ananassa]
MDPRISFSNDFADAQQVIKHEAIYREAPVSADFEFSVNNLGMIAADEVIFQGTLLPLKDNVANQGGKTTLRDELLAEDDYSDMFSRPSRSLSRWKERLGLKRSQIVPKKTDRSTHGGLESIVEERRHVFVHEAILISKQT